MTRYAKLTVFMATVLILVGAGFAAGKKSGANSTSTASASTTSDPNNPFYLVVGASASIGFQPSGIPAHNGRRTLDSYANDFVTFEKAHGFTFDLTQIGCPGETALSMSHLTTQDHCYTLPTTQLTKAMGFLEKNQNRAGLVSIDIGFNDIRPCLAAVPVNDACANTAIQNVQRYLPIIVDRLRSVAGPNVVFVGFKYEDPFVAHYLEGPGSISNAQTTLDYMNRLDGVITSVYTKTHVAIADLAAKWNMNDASPVTIPNVGTVPLNVYDACLYSWMCQPKPFGPDDHPNNAGYMLIAEAIAEVLPNQWRYNPVVYATTTTTTTATTTTSTTVPGG